jgi:glycosyltransferase involved in cell wall biosynthesis
MGHFAHIDELLVWAKGFSPDVIYARPLDRPSFSIWLPRWLSRQLEIPYITRILDDWPTRHEHDPIWVRRVYWQLFLSKEFKKLLARSVINVGISDEMCKAFEKRYQAKFVTFHNCVDLSSWMPEKTDYSFKQPFKMVYMGAVKKDKELHSLIDICEIVLKLNEQNHKIHFTLYGPEAYAETVSEYLEVEPVIKYGGFFPPHEKFAILKKADLLVLPLNFDRRSTEYLGYSFQTKVPEYMASGTPTLVYGPAENPNVSYATQERWAAVVDKPDKHRLASALEQLILDQEYRQRLGKHARQLALRNHDANSIQPRFQQLIRDIASQKPISS